MARSKGQVTRKPEPTRPETFRFVAHDTIGATDAEHDNTFLSDCFVDTGDLAVLMDCQDPRCVVLGRVGVGKSALLEMLRARHQARTIVLPPEKLALSHIANSDILRFAHEVGAELNVFFRLLWRHVIAVEILTVRFDLDSENAVTQLLDKLALSSKGKRRAKALAYLKEWAPSFWKESDYRIKEITQRLEREIAAGAKIGPITAGLADKLTTEVKTEVRQRVQHVVNQGQVRELADILPLIDDVLDDPQKRYYVLIDRLDEGWIHDNLRFRLIRSLVETAREFASVTNAKVVITMRTDLHREVLARTREAGFQREKHETILLLPRWTKAQLRDVINRRVAALVARRYTSATVTIEDVFYKWKGHQDDPIAYIISRTLMRPRDAIQYVNHIIRASNDKAQISRKAITTAETEYSRGRVESIVDEWSSLWPSLPVLIECLPRGRTHLQLKELDLNEVAIRIFASLGLSDFDALPVADPLASAVRNYYHASSSTESPSLTELHRAVVAMLYDSGFCGIHVGKEPPQYSYEYPMRIMTEKELVDAQLPFHKTFYSFLDVPPTLSQ